eukprot:13701940-Heterocapsa_arctica.AAC.1
MVEVEVEVEVEVDLVVGEVEVVLPVLDLLSGRRLLLGATARKGAASARQRGVRHCAGAPLGSRAQALGRPAGR